MKCPRKDTKQKQNKHGPLQESEVGSGAVEELALCRNWENREIRRQFDE